MNAFIYETLKNTMVIMIEMKFSISGIFFVLVAASLYKSESI